MATVKLIEVSKKVGSTTILEKVNLSIQKGEFIVIVGPSGCGKTTLLRLIAGLEDLSSGSILINDQCVNEISPAKRDMAMVFQNYALYPHMTVFENMAYGLKMRGFKKEEIQTRVDKAAKLLHIKPFLDRKPQALSGGQKQRVAMGRAIVRAPAVFLFDEPLSNLDAKLRTEMRHEIRRLHQQLNITSLYVTHDQTEAMTMAGRVIVLNQGIVEQMGTPQELYQTPETLFVAGFTGQYPMNLIKGTFNKNTHSMQTDLGIDYPLPANTPGMTDKEELIMAIRSEHVLLCSESSPQRIPVQVEFVDDMGADKIIRTRCERNNQIIQLRVTDCTLPSGQIWVELPNIKLHFFHRKSGQRIGEGRE